VWFILDGDDLLFQTGLDTVKGRALLRDPRISIAVDDQRPPFSFVHLQGEATVSEDLDELRRYAIPIAGRYMGADNAEEVGRRNAVEGEVLVRVRVTKVVAQRALAA
jgi:PPOX class probable F420-dependent enzyme